MLMFELRWGRWWQILNRVSRGLTDHYLVKGLFKLSLKINRQSDLDELFSKFAVEPDKTPKKEELSKDKKQNDKQKKEQK